MLMNICETWDDVVDGDERNVDLAMEQAFVHLAMNGFWRQYRGFLEPIVIASVNAWRDATVMEKADSHRMRNLAFHLRNWPTELIPMIAFLCGGWHHARQVSPEIREFFAHESYEDWEHAL